MNAINWEAIIFLVTIIFMGGGLVMFLKTLSKKVDQHEIRLNNHEEHFARHDVIFEHIMVSLDYMRKAIDRLEQKVDSQIFTRKE